MKRHYPLQKCSFNKLTLVNGNQLLDPCALIEWVEDVSKWTNIQGPDSCVINKPSVYTCEKLQAYKSLNDYDYAI